MRDVAAAPSQIKHGETFVSETDTEVIPKLCKFVYERLTEKVPFPKVRARVKEREWWKNGGRFRMSRLCFTLLLGCEG